MNKSSFRRMLHVLYLKISGIPEADLGPLAGSRLSITMLMNRSR